MGRGYKASFFFCKELVARVLCRRKGRLIPLPIKSVRWILTETVGTFDKCETQTRTGHIHHLPSDNSLSRDLWLIKPILLPLRLPFATIKLRFPQSRSTIYHQITVDPSNLTKPALLRLSFSIVSCHYCLFFRSECFNFHCQDEELRVAPK